MRKVKRGLTFEERSHVSNLYCTDDAWVMSNLYCADDAWVRSPSSPSVTMNKDVVIAKNRLKKLICA